MPAGEEATGTRPDLGFQITFPAAFEVESAAGKELVFAVTHESSGGLASTMGFVHL